MGRSGPQRHSLRSDWGAEALPDALAGAELPRLRWHDLRAVHGGLLPLSGVDIAVVRRMLGHSAITVTAKHYAGVSDALDRQASERPAALLAYPGDPVRGRG